MENKVTSTHAVSMDLSDLPVLIFFLKNPLHSVFYSNIILYIMVISFKYVKFK